VSVTTDKLTYRRGEPILVTITNGLSTVIYAVPAQVCCSIVSVHRRHDGRWVTEGVGPTAGPAFFIAIASKSKMTGTLGLVSQDADTGGPIVSKPSSPSVFEDDLRTLPTVEPWKPGDPIREVPRGGNPPGANTVPFDALYSKIGPGTYRIVLGFTMDVTTGMIQTVYSKEFIVSG
jgi:hypothetical protein